MKGYLDPCKMQEVVIFPWDSPRGPISVNWWIPFLGTCVLECWKCLYLDLGIHFLAKNLRVGRKSARDQSRGLGLGGSSSFWGGFFEKSKQKWANIWSNPYRPTYCKVDSGCGNLEALPREMMKHLAYMIWFELMRNFPGFPCWFCWVSDATHQLKKSLVDVPYDVSHRQWWRRPLKFIDCKVVTSCDRKLIADFFLVGTSKPSRAVSNNRRLQNSKTQHMVPSLTPLWRRWDRWWSIPPWNLGFDRVGTWKAGSNLGYPLPKTNMAMENPPWMKMYFSLKMWISRPVMLGFRDVITFHNKHKVCHFLYLKLFWPPTTQ